MCNRIMCLASSLFALGLAAGALAQINVAEELLVDLRADDLSYGQDTGAWPNRGTLGDFTAQGAPVVEDISGLKAITFDGTSWFDGPASVPGIEGAGTRSIEVWVFNPTTVGEETMVHWSHRGGPEGTNIAFNYGNHTTWGAVGHWGAPDMPWGGSVVPTPTLGQWWHLVYTYDGTTVRLYANGQPAGDRGITLNTHAGNLIRIAAQGDDSGQGVVSALSFTGSIAEVRIHDGVLTGQQVQGNFQQGGPRKAHNPSPADGAIGVPMPLLQWSAGMTARWHNVYLGTNPELGPVDLVASRTMLTLYYHAIGFEPGVTYYWRVDEIELDDTVHTGDVWTLMATPVTAFAPTPRDGGRFLATDVDLAWSMGQNADSHDVYFSADRDEVANGVAEAFQGNQPLTGFDPGPLEAGLTYYWRVDEIDSAGSKKIGPVWSFTTVPDSAVSDPHLVGWWKLDEGEGNLASDSSGQGNHGTIHGGIQWIDGPDGGALRLGGENGYIALPIGSVIASLDSTTISMWANFSNAGGAWQRLFDFGSSNATGYMFLCPRTDTTGPIRFAITATGNAAGAESIIDTSATLPTGWHHVAVAIDAATNAVQLYLDGQPTASGSIQTLPSDLGETTNNWIGRSQYGTDAYFRGAVDDVRIYDFAMTLEEIPETMRGDPMLAWSPYPSNDGIVDIRTATPLTWSAGDQASRHDVYLGTDPEAVAKADASDTTGLYCGRQAGDSYSPTESLAWGQTYYWRIDEVNADDTISQGRVWSFTVAAYLIVDDFEGYTDDMDAGLAIFQTWTDGIENGTGSTVGYWEAHNGTFGETVIVNSGSQSMPFDYNNINSPWYSEAYRQWQSPRDWTDHGADSLVVHFRGNPVSFVQTGEGTFTMSASGVDIWDTVDEFRYAYKTLSGNGSIVARVDSLANTNGWAKAGVMIRESADPSSKHAFVVVTPSNGVSFGWRAFSNDLSNQVNITGMQAPQYVKLTREGNAFTAQYSADGAAWTDMTDADGVITTSISMSGSPLIGLCLTSHNATAVTTAEFSNVTTPGATGPWRMAEIGTDHPGNSPEQFYVVIEDAAGKQATVVHPDPEATLTTEWAQWRIPLADLVGLNAARVQKMTIGVGDPDQPTPGGAGLLYIDDIRLMQPSAAE